MNSKERVLAAFEHVEGDHVPAWLGGSPEFRELARQHLGLDDDESLSVHLGDDFRRIFAKYAGPEHADPFLNLQPGATYRTPFGVERHGYGHGMSLNRPLVNATSLAEVHKYLWPDPEWMDVSHIRTETLKYDGQYAILSGDWSPFWHDAIDFLTMENLCYKMFDDPEFVDALMKHFVDYYAGVSQRIFDAAGDVIDIFFIGNDFGAQNGPLLGEELFRRFILPHLKRVIDLGHDYGLKVVLHCCGGFAPLIPAMIEVGLDGLHACCLKDVNELILDCFDKPGWVHEFLNYLLEKKLQFIDSMKAAKFDLIETGGGAASSTLISPNLHKEFCTPYDRKIHDALHDLGFKISYHTCGGTLGIEEMIVANGCDVSETLAPVSIGGNQEPWEFAAKIGDRLALIGGVDQFNVLTNGTKEDIRAKVRELLEKVGPNGGYICAACDHFFETPVENLKASADAATKCVY